MKHALFAFGLAVSLLTGCARPAEVRNLSAVVHPIAVQMKANSQDLQTRFAAQRAMIEGRAADLKRIAADRRARTLDIQRVWRMSNDEARLRRLAILRENDEQILAAPLASVMGQTGPAASKPAKVNQGSIDAVIKGAASLRNRQAWRAQDFMEYLQSVNAALGELEKEQAGSQSPPESAPTPAPTPVP